jgi:UDP-glucuronate 4-epimerase
MFQNKTILVTGAAGFIGYHLTNRLLSEGWKVIGLDNLNDYYDVNLKFSRLANLGIDKKNVQYDKLIKSNVFENCSFIKLNLEDTENITKLFNNYSFEVVCNLGAQAGVRYSLENPLLYATSNIIGFINILEQCKAHKIKHLVYASSSSVYGLNEKMPFSTHDSANHPVSLYAATKKSNELMAHVYSKVYNLPTTGLRFFTVYGPWGRPDMSPMLFAYAINNEKPIKIFNHGNMERDFTYIDDIIEGVVRVIHRPAAASEWDGQNPDPASSNVPYRIYNIGNSNPVKLMDYIETMENTFGKKAIKEFLPMQSGDLLNTYCDVSDMEREFGHRPQTTIKEGIERFAKWYKEFYS